MFWLKLHNVGKLCVAKGSLGPVQTSYFCCIEFNANEQKPLFELICIEFDATEMQRLGSCFFNVYTLCSSVEIISLISSGNMLCWLKQLESSIWLFLLIKWMTQLLNGTIQGETLSSITVLPASCVSLHIFHMK